MAHRARAAVAPLNAAIKIVDGDVLLALNDVSMEAMCDAFEARIVTVYGR